MDFENTDYNLILKKSMENLQTNVKLIEILKSTGRILCPELAVSLARTYFELEAEEDFFLDKWETTDEDTFTYIISSAVCNIELIKEIAELDLANGGGNLKRCLNYTPNLQTIESGEFIEKEDMIHMNFAD